MTQTNLLTATTSINDLEDVCNDAIKDGTAERAEITMNEWFSDGTYARQVVIPANTCLVGETHKEEWIIIVSKGIIEVSTDDGPAITIDASERPQTFISKAGVKRAGFAHTETWWTGLRRTDLLTEADIREEQLVNDSNNWNKLICGSLPQ